MRSNQGEVYPDSCRTATFHKDLTHCHCYQVPIQRPRIELTPYLTVKLFNNELPSIDSTSSHITLQRATSPEALSTISVTSESTKSKRSIVPSTSLTFSDSKTEKQLTSSSSTSTAITTTLMTTPSPLVPNMTVLSTSTSSPSVPNMTASLTSTSLASTQSKPTKALTKPESSTTSPNLAMAASTTSTSTGLTSVTSTVGKRSTRATLSTCLTSATFVTSKSTNQSMSSKLLITSPTSPRTTTTAINQSTFLWLSQLMLLLLMCISSVVSFPTQPAGTYGDNNITVYVKQPTPLVTIELSVLDQKQTKTTAETKTGDHITHSRLQTDNGHHFSPEISVKLINLLGSPSTSNPIFDVSGTDSSQFVTESDNETILLDTKPTSAPTNQSVNLAVIPVLGIFFLMVILWMKCSTWFRDHLRDQDLEDDGKEYVILSPPEEGYREVEFRSDTSSMYYDTVSSYRSILRQKVEYGGFNNYDTVTSIRSILQQRTDVRDAAVQVKLQGEHLKTDRWKSVSGILNNSGSSSDLLKVPKKTHRQVSFQTSQNESYDPPLQLTCDANIQVGDSSTERMKNKEQARLLQKPVDPNLGSGAEVSKYFGSGTQLSMQSSNASLIGLNIFGVPYPSTSHQEGNDATRQQEMPGSDGSGGGEHEGSTGETSSYGGTSSVTSKDEPAQCEIINPKHRRVHQFQVLRVDSSDGLYREPVQSKDAELTSETTDVSEKDSTLLTETSQDDYSLAQPLPHPHHYLCRRLKQAKRRCKDPTGPIADSISDFKPPIFSEVKFGQPPSDEDECDYGDDINLQVKHGAQQNCGLSQTLFIDENNENNCWCEQAMESGKGDKLNQLLEAHASSVAAAPRASPISMHSSAASSTLSSHSSCSSLEAIKDEINDEDGGEDGRGLNLPQDASCYIAQGMYAEEETPLIMDLAGDSPCQSPEIHALVRQRGHRSSSGYETQGHETPSTAKGHVPETGDTSCDVTPLTSSTNSLHECCDGKRCTILAEAQSAQHPLSTHLHQQPLPHPQHHLHHHHPYHHHHHQQQQQQDQLAETLMIHPGVPQDTSRIPSYIPHNTFRQETRHDDNNNNNNSLRRSVMERNQSLDQRLSLPSTSATRNTNNNSSSSSTIGGGITGDSGNNNNNNSNTSRNQIQRIPDTGSEDLRSTATGSTRLAEPKIVKQEEPIDFKRFHRKPVPPILREKEPLLLPSNYIAPTTTPTADVHLPNTKTDSNFEIV
ncbi:serine-rich adhesin for platelets isoform X2 [Octopus bimaculoides]|uniref:Uncharacterized protein n=2 Tax=Octopus bimaculoides TaxID=37653 RepID=A0A0L8HSM9_OCTBM|nr:serine-rich adhesin for platelets isoform X2 [Octopus bimaculoides]|eukprot:XP_014770060.1 PREDICTED: serine-rich adhesin for platelets-like isoform X2 [Octopus bimaculoides]